MTIKIPIIKSKSISEWISDDYRASDIFKKYGIELCSNGDITLLEICEQNGISYENILQELETLKRKNQRHLNCEDWEADRLIYHIMDTHHHYVNTNMDPILHYADETIKIHGDTHPELLRVRSLFKLFVVEFRKHLKEEEEKVFPYILNLVIAKSIGSDKPSGEIFQINNPEKGMKDDHHLAKDLVSKIREVTNNYLLPDDVCNTFKVFYNKLEEFEADLITHIHLEDKILFPKIAELEKSFA
ncbi:MAG: DUF542 domain-containing protein [Saprospiraceae bacterium]|nr:DUF542 domain-containing protein [Saprospiraceae bacterium]